MNEKEFFKLIQFSLKNFKDCTIYKDAIKIFIHCMDFKIYIDTGIYIEDTVINKNPTYKQVKDFLQIINDKQDITENTI